MFRTKLISSKGVELKVDHNGDLLGSLIKTLDGSNIRVIDGNTIAVKLRNGETVYLTIKSDRHVSQRKK